MWALAENKVPVNLDNVVSITKVQDRALGSVATSIRFDVPGGTAPIVWMFDSVMERDEAYDAVTSLIVEAQEKPKRGRPPKAETDEVKAPAKKAAKKTTA